MSKMMTKTVKSVTLFSVILAILLAASIVVTALLGVNYADTLKDCNALTITVNSKAFEDKLDAIETKCEDAFETLGLDYNLIKYGKMSGDDCEIVYEFDKDADLTEAKSKLSKTFADITAADGEWNGSFISVSSASEVALTKIPTAYVVRAAVAVAVFAVLAFVYVSLRYRLSMGILAAVCSLLGSVMATALVLLVRIPLTNSFLYIAALAAPATAVLVLLTLNKLRAALKSDEEVSAAEWITSCVATKELMAIAVVGGVALVLLGAIATAGVRWFAIAALAAFVMVMFIGAMFAPAAYLPLKKWEDKRNAAKPKSGYVGAEKQE